MNFIVKGDDHDFVIRMNLLHEPDGLVLDARQFALGAAARVQHQGHSEGRIYGREIGNLLLHLVFVNCEVLLLQVREEVARGASHGNRQVDQVNIDLQRVGFFLLGAFGFVFLGQGPQSQSAGYQQESDDE